MADPALRILYTGPDEVPVAALSDRFVVRHVPAAEVFEVASACDFDVFLVHEVAGADALTEWLEGHICRASTVVLTAADDVEAAAGYVRNGASDVLAVDELTAGRLERALHMAHARNAALDARAWEDERYRLMVEHARDVVCVVDGYGRFSYVSPSVEDVQGIPPEELVGQSAFEMIHEDDLERVIDVFMEAVAEPGSERDLSYRIYTADGGVRWMEGVGRSIIGPDGHPYGVINARDVTERKEAEFALRESEARYRALTQALPDAIARVGLDGTVRDYHLPASFETEVRPENILGLRLQHLLPAELATGFEAFLTRLDEADEARDTVTGRYEIVVGGKTRHREVRITNNGPDEVLCILRDVTAEVETEKALRAQEEFLHQVVTRVPVVLFAIDPDGQFTLAVGQGLERIGVAPEEIVGRSTDEVLASYPKMAAAIQRALQGESFESTFIIGRRSLEVYAAPVYDVAGQVVRIIGVGADVTELKEKQEALERSRAELRELAAHLQHIREEERRRISREVHDILGQALTGIRLGVGWLGRRLDDDAEGQERVGEIQGRIDETIQHVRDIAAQLRPGILDDFGLASAMEWQSAEFEKHAGIPCHLHLDGPEEAVPEDVATALFRIFQESLTNIVRHAQASSANVTLRIDEDRVVLSVRDDGVGISQQALERGQNLGLLGMQERAVVLGGTVRVTGALGEGACVEAQIPLAPTLAGAGELAGAVEPSSGPVV